MKNLRRRLMGDGNIFSEYISDIEAAQNRQTDLFGLEIEALSPLGEKEYKKKKKAIGEKNKSQSQFKDSEHEALALQSQQSQFKKKIQEEELNSIKLEREKINLLKAAGEVGEIAFFEFCYVSYMEKINVDSFKMINRIEERILSLADQKKGSAIVEMIKKELTNVIRSVKIAQENEVKRWASD